MLALALAATTLIIDPPAVDLTCMLDDRGKQNVMEVRLNETAGTATWQWANRANSVTKAASFAPSLVEFAGFSIDRRTLKITRVNDTRLVEDHVLPPQTFGTCVVLPAKRAF